MSYKKSFIIMVSIIVFGLLGIATFNYQVDPAGLFRLNKYESGIADILIKKQNVANISNYDERLVQKYLIEKSIEKRDVLVLGSSRVMQIHDYLFPQQTFFNHSVSGASIEDDIAIVAMYKERNWIPQKIIIGLDPWLLNKYHGQNRWQSIQEEYNNGSVYLGLDNNNEKATCFNKSFYRKYIELISLPYFKASYNKWRRPKNNEYYTTMERESTVAIKLADGTISYPDNERNISVEDAKKRAVIYASSDPIYSIGNFDKLDEDNKIKFEIFIKYLQKHKIEVVFFLPPYHPAVYDALVNNPQYSVALETERYFRNFAQQQNILVVGAYNPVECWLSDADFYDGMHAKPQAIDKIFNRSN